MHRGRARRHSLGLRLGSALLVLPLLLAGMGASVQAGDGPFREAFEPPQAPLEATGAAGRVGGAGVSLRRPLARLVTLRAGAEARLLEAEGFKPRSYSQVHLRLKNTSGEPLRVDVCGSHLLPRRTGSCQRLGLGPQVTPRGKRKRKAHPRPPDQPPGTVIIGLKAGEQKVVHLWTCCLDAGTPAPKKHVFRVATDPLPEVREEALRWWAENPDAPQGVVNRAIWQFRPVDEGSAFEFMRGTRRPRMMGGNGLAVHAGSVYMLRAGELMARDPDGIERFLGTQMDGVFPTDSALYAISWGSHGGSTVRSAPPPRELWRLVPTGDEPWAHVATIPNDLRVDRVQVAPNGGILVLTDAGLYRVDRGAKRLREVLRTQDTENLSVSFQRNGRALVTHRRPAGAGYVQGGERKGESSPVCELWEVDAKTGARERTRELWNVRQLQTGPAGTYALTPGGKLRRLQGRSFRNAPGQQAYDRLVRVGRKYVWLESKRGRLVAVDKAGRIRFESGPRMPEDGAWAMDPHDDRIVWRSGHEYWRLEPGRGERAKLESLVRER